jgi:hypothetical protein
VPDLFDIFPDLPHTRRPSQQQRLEDLRRRVIAVRQRAQAAAVKQKLAAAKAVSRRGRRQ